MAKHIDNIGPTVQDSAKLQASGGKNCDKLGAYFLLGDPVRIRTLALALVFSMTMLPVVAMGSAPPEIIELTQTNMKSLGFAYSLSRTGDSTEFELQFPAKVGANLTPHSSELETKSLNGEPVQRSTVWVGSEHRYIQSKFKHTQFDTSISVLFCRQPGSNSCKRFLLSSLSKLASR